MQHAQREGRVLDAHGRRVLVDERPKGQPWWSLMPPPGTRVVIGGCEFEMAAVGDAGIMLRYRIVTKRAFEKLVAGARESGASEADIERSRKSYAEAQEALRKRDEEMARKSKGAD